MMFGVAMLVMIGVTTAVHLGLPQAIAGIISKVCRCHKCLSFWSTLLVLIYVGVHPVVAALLSLLSGYLSGWIAIVLLMLNRLYERLWERVKK